MNDLNFALRQLLKHPGFAAVAVFTLALGLGANTAMFSFADGLLWRPLALPALERLVTVWQAPETQPQARESVSAVDYLAWKEEARSLASLAALQGVSANLTGTEHPERVSGARVSGGYFGTLGMQPRLGRLFGSPREFSEPDPVVVISENLWRRRFGADPHLLGQTLALDGRRHTVMGVVSAAQAYPVGADFWVPLALDPAARHDATRRDLELVGRLQPDALVAGAESELRTLAARQQWLGPPGGPVRPPRLVPLRDHLLANSEAPAYLFIVVLAATFLLALACANVANLEVAQMHGRQREFAIRSALGGDSGRLTRQVLTESTVLCLAGGLAALVVAQGTIRLIRASLPPDLLPYVPGWSAVGLSGRAFAYAAGAALLAGLLAGMAPVFMLPRNRLDTVLRQGARGSSGGRRHRLRQGLVVVELALALVMLVASCLFVKAFAGLVFARQGFEADRVLTLRVSLPPSRYTEHHAVTRFYEEALREIASLPGVDSSSLASTLPYYGTEESLFAAHRAAPDQPEEPGRRFAVEAVTPDHFRTFRISVRQGRSFLSVDTPQSAPVAMVSEAVARQLWPGDSPLGRTLWLNPAAPDARPLTVVGVVADVRRDWRREAPGSVYVPFSQASRPAMFVSVRTADNPVRHTAAIRRRIQQLDAAQPLPQPKPMKQVVVESMAGLFITAGVLTFMGGIALLVAAAGVYSVVANSVSQRTREMGIRLALGARPGDVQRQVLGEGLRLAAVGVGVGLPVAVVVSLLFRAAVVGIPVLTASWYGLLAVLLMGVTLLACHLPARRASRIDPQIALRSE
jgi:putative ABC transport system permease protein